MSKELVQFLHSKLEPNDFAGAMMVLHTGDPQDLGMDYDPDNPAALDEPPYRGRDVPRTGGIKAQDTAMLRKRVADAQVRGLRLADDHRKSLGLSKIRDLGP